MASIFKQQYTAKDKTGRRIKKKSRYWYIDYKAAEGTRKRVKGFKDKQATAQLAAKLEKESELEQAGIVDKFKEHRKKPLAEHLNEFKASLVNKGTTEKHACLVHNRTKAVIENCKFVFMADVSASRVQRYLAERRREGLSIRSSNFYLQAAKQFCRWLVADGRAPENPLAHLSGQNPKTDVRHARRALSNDELERLIKATANGLTHSKMTGKERAMLYVLAVSTGLRAGELAFLTWQSFNLSGSEPSVTVLAAYSKHRRDDVVPLRSDMAQHLRTWKAEQGAADTSRVFGNFKINKAAKMLRKDLEATGIPYRDGAGRVADFHSLRHTFISSLSKSGVSPKVAQSLARHSTISLTMDTYTHIGLHDERAAIESLHELPSLSGKQREAATEAGLRTGTDDLPVDGSESACKCAYKPAYKKLTKNAFPESNTSAPIGNEEHETPTPDTNHNSLIRKTLATERNHLSPAGMDKNERRRPDSNRRITVLQTVALDHLATPPYLKMSMHFTLVYLLVQQEILSRMLIGCTLRL